jgi:uncharacterized protein
MSKLKKRQFEREQTEVLVRRLKEPRRFIQVVAGARQVGKNTLVNQVLERLGCPSHFASVDEPTLGDTSWLTAQWDRARLTLSDARSGGVVLALDEAQKIPGWAETVKRLWDEDTRARRQLKVVLLGSAPLFVQQGLTESLAGRLEQLRL